MRTRTEPCAHAVSVPWKLAAVSFRFISASALRITVPFDPAKSTTKPAASTLPVVFRSVARACIAVTRIGPVMLRTSTAEKEAWTVNGASVGASTIRLTPDRHFIWWARGDSNARPLPCQGSAGINLQDAALKTRRLFHREVLRNCYGDAEVLRIATAFRARVGRRQQKFVK